MVSALPKYAIHGPLAVRSTLVIFAASSGEKSCDFTSSAVFRLKVLEMKMPFDDSCGWAGDGWLFCLF